MFKNKSYLQINIFLAAFLTTFASLFCAANTLKSNRSEFVPNQLIVKFKIASNQKTLNFQRNFMQIYKAEVITKFKSNNAFLVQFPESTLNQQKNGLMGLLSQFNSSAEIEYAEPNWILHNNSLPNDPFFDQLHALNASASRNANIKAIDAWTKTTGSKKVLVAVIDSGVDYNHQDLIENYWNNPGETGTDAKGQDKKTNGADDDKNGFIDDWKGWNFLDNTNDPMDDNNHGTHCAGTIGAVGNNGIGVVGVNWNVSLMGLKFLDSTGTGSLANGVLAIEYATKMGVHIMNNSWGGDEYSQTMAAAIQKANDAGILFVVAAGNSGNDNDIGYDYPASYTIDNVVSVAAIDGEGELAGFSNFGAKTVSIAAPGTDIYSTFPNNDYGTQSGTSMAAPYIAGAAALIKAKYPNLMAREIKARLLGSATKTSGLKDKVQSGLLNIAYALDDDQAAPTTPKEISIVETSASSLILEWNTSTDSGKDKTAFNYEIRHSEKKIESENDWNSATIAKSEVISSDANKTRVEVEILPINSSGFLAIRALDRFGNQSDISANISFSLKSVSPIYSNKGDNLNGIEIEGPWGIENIPGHGKVISDSPGDVYGYHKTSFITLPAVKVSATDVVFSFNAKFDFELGFDYGYLEYSTDNGGSWNQITQLTGARDWSTYHFSLKNQLSQSESNDRYDRYDRYNRYVRFDQEIKLDQEIRNFRYDRNIQNDRYDRLKAHPFANKTDFTLLFRFKIVSDPTTSKDGIFISDINIWK